MVYEIIPHINWIRFHPRKIPRNNFCYCSVEQRETNLYLRKSKDQNLLIGSRKSLLHGSSPRPVFVWSRTSRVTFLSSWFRFRDLSNELSIILREILHPQAQLVFQEFQRNLGWFVWKWAMTLAQKKTAKKQLSDFCTWEPNRKFSVLNPVSGMESFKFHPQNGPLQMKKTSTLRSWNMEFHWGWTLRHSGAQASGLLPTNP